MAGYVTEKNLKDKTRGWLKRIKPYNLHRMKLNVGRSALIVIDMQKFFLDPKSPTFAAGGLAILPNVKKLIKTFRKSERPVVFTRHGHHPDRIDVGIMGWWWQGMIVEGSPESEIHDDLKPLKNEKVIAKHRYSAFYNTDLETVFRCMKIEDIVICGVLTNCCCETTGRDAYMRDFRVFFLADATGAADEEMHLASLINLAYGFAYVTTTDEVVGMVGGERAIGEGLKAMDDS